MVNASNTGLRPPSRQGNYLPHETAPSTDDDESTIQATEPIKPRVFEPAAAAAAAAAAASGDQHCSNNTVQTAQTEKSSDTEKSLTNTTTHTPKVQLRRSHLRPRNRDVEDKRRRSSASKHQRKQTGKKERSLHRPRRSKSVDSASGLPGLRKNTNLNNSIRSSGGRGLSATSNRRRSSVRQRTTGGDTTNKEEVSTSTNSSSTRRSVVLTAAEVDKAFDMLNVSESSFLPSRLVRSPSRESSRGRGSSRSGKDGSTSPKRKTLPDGLTAVSPTSARGTKRKSKTSKSSGTTSKKGLSQSARLSSSAATALSDRLSSSGSSNNQRRTSSSGTTKTRRKSSKTATATKSVKKKKSILVGDDDQGQMRMSQSERVGSSSIRASAVGDALISDHHKRSSHTKRIKKKRSSHGNNPSSSAVVGASLRMSQSARLESDEEPMLERSIRLEELRRDKSSSRRGKRSSWAYGGNASFHLTTTRKGSPSSGEDAEHEKLNKSAGNLPSYHWELHDSGSTMNNNNNRNNNSKGLLDELRADKSTRTTRTDTPFPVPGLGGKPQQQQQQQQAAVHERMSQSAHEFGTTSNDLKNTHHRISALNDGSSNDDEQRVLPKGSIRTRSERGSTHRSSRTGEKSMRSSTRSSTLSKDTATTKRRVSKTKDKGDSKTAHGGRRRASHRPKPSKPIMTRDESPPPLMLQPLAQQSPPVTPIPAVKTTTNTKRRRHTSPTPIAKPFHELHKLQQGPEDAMAALARSFRSISDDDDEDDDDENDVGGGGGGSATHRNSLFQLPMQLGLNKEQDKSARSQRSTTEEESDSEEMSQMSEFGTAVSSASTISSNSDDDEVNNEKRASPPQQRAEMMTKGTSSTTIGSSSEEGGGGSPTPMNDNSFTTACSRRTRSRVSFDDHRVVEHAGEDVTREWYSKECLAELINHEIQIVSRCGLQHEGSRGNYKSLHCCWRGLEHIQHQYDKMQHMQEHVQSVKTKYATLMQEQQRDSNITNGWNETVAEALRSYSRAETKEDRKRAIILGQEDAKFVENLIEFHRKCDAANAADEERNSSLRGGARSSLVLPRVSVLNPVATQYVSDTLRDVVTTNTSSFRSLTAVGSDAAVGGTPSKQQRVSSSSVVEVASDTTRRLSDAVVGATTNASKLVADTVLGPIRGATASLRSGGDSKLRGSCIKVV